MKSSVEDFGVPLFGVVIDEKQQKRQKKKKVEALEGRQWNKKTFNCYLNETSECHMLNSEKMGTMQTLV